MLYPCFDVMVNCVIKVPWTDIAPEYDKLTNGRAVFPYLGTDISPRYDN